MTSETSEKLLSSTGQGFYHHNRGLIVLLEWSVLLCLFLTYTGIIPTRKTTIACDDPRIKMVFTGDTITPWTLFAGCYFGALFWMMATEWLTRSKEKVWRSMRTSFSRSWSASVDLFIGGTFSFFIVELLKVTVSEARPHFFQTCSPNLTDDLCTNRYVTLSWENCTNPGNVSMSKLIDTMKSFPSGHACLGSFSATFMIVYLHTKRNSCPAKLLFPLFQLLWLTWAVMCSVTRSWDNKHHWWDILVGDIIGLACAVFVVKYISNLFRDSNKVYPKPEENVMTLSTNKNLLTCGRRSVKPAEENELQYVSDLSN